MTVKQRARNYEWHDPAEVARAIFGREHVDWMKATIAGDVPAAPFATTLGMKAEHAENGHVTFSMDLHEWMANPVGVVHGGMAATILDSVLTLAVTTRLPRGKFCTTVDLNVHFVRPMFPTGERVVADGHAVHVGATLCTAEARLIDGRGKVLAHATGSFAIVDAESVKPR
jgi:uncharacterized protein (TIGR00369 family)